jgi:hypothetical protein
MKIITTLTIFKITILQGDLQRDVISLPTKCYWILSINMATSSVSVSALPEALEIVSRILPRSD